jgi:hypothetical protein
MKFIKYTDKGKLEKYVNSRTVITFLTSRNKIFVLKRQHGGKQKYINMLIENGYSRVTMKAGA